MLVEMDGQVARTQAVLTELEGAFSDVRRAESGTRGYVATGQEEYLSLLGGGIADSAQRLRTLRSLIADAQQKRNLEGLTLLIERKTAVMQHLVALRRDQGFAAASEELRKGEGLRLMNEIRGQVDAMRTLDDGLLQVRQAASRRRARIANALTALGTLLAVAFMLVAAWSARRDARERQRTEAALQESEADFRTLADGVPQMVWMCTPDGLNIYFNQRWVEYTGLSLQESYGRGWNTPFHPDDKQPAWDAWNHATETGETYRVESRLRASDGTYRWFLMRGEPLRDAAGRIVKWFGTCTDIEELKRGEVAIRKATEGLRRANAYNRSLLEASLDPLVTIAPDGKITDVNRATEQVTGLTRKELVGTDFSDYFTDPEKARAGYQQVFREGSVQDYELEVRHRDGRVTPVLYNASVYRDDAGKVIGVFAAARDIAEQKRASEALRRASAYNRSLLEASLDPLVTIAPDGKITDVNRATEQVTGRTRQELVGTDFSDYFTDPQKARAGYQQAFREGWVQDHELEVRRRDGHVTSVVYNASVYRDETDRTIGVFAAARDITERKQAEEALKEYSAELARSNADLQQFAYVASHDLQEPLRMVASYTQLLAKRYRGKLDSDADDFIGYAVDGARRMQSLINNLLSYSRVGTRGKAFAATDCEGVLQEVLTNLQQSILDTSATVTHEHLPTVQGDAPQLVQVFQNLIGNALKFHGTELPRVHISAEDQDGDWRFTVRDNGIGIDPQYADRIFVIFQRLHTLAEYPGAGMGLAIAKKIVERHGGRIWVESEPGKGSTFYFTVQKNKR
jgi:PAS domain S-box-containing protein